MASSSTPMVKKRGRPPKYETAEQKQVKYAQTRRTQRQAALATERTAQFDQFYSTRPATYPTRPIPPTPGTLEPSITYQLEELLPPLSPGLAPQELDDNNIDDPSPPPNCPRDMSPPPETLILPTPLMRTRVLADQLYQHHGCCHQCHEQQHTAHQEAHPVHTTLANYLEQINPDRDFPDVLGSPTIATHGSNLAEQVTPERKQQVYCGVDPHQPDAVPTHLCIAANHHPGLTPEVTLDIDSVGGFVKSLAVA
ncbi:hypothetical protein FE257_006693 [Aspergillus nanangensis]|uniref:Uncharacterized protein n=1 Tax=Aspergillus nanangensis TaxID=2582783 RepID=A0AAD4CQL6_ASPNN|nr:hypothetical protein FE257_006693 [Aspergillus nanangensis]